MKKLVSIRKKFRKKSIRAKVEKKKIIKQLERSDFLQWGATTVNGVKQ